MVPVSRASSAVLGSASARELESFVYEVDFFEVDFLAFSWAWPMRVEFADTRSRVVLGVTKGALSDGTLGWS